MKYVIAEVGNNHNGSVDAAKRLIDGAELAGADAVKFQLRGRSLYRGLDHGVQEDLGVEYIKDLLSKYDLNLNEHEELFEYCSDRQISYLCTPWDDSSLDVLKSWKCSMVKIASADFDNLPFISKALDSFETVIVSTGMADEKEIGEFAKYYANHLDRLIVMHCVSAYPAPAHDLNLRYLPILNALFPNVGYSGHERGILASVIAYSLGARYIEKHITLDNSLEGPDHMASILPNELSELVNLIVSAEEFLGLPIKGLSQGQLINKENLAKSLVAKENIDIGELAHSSLFEIRSPGFGLSPLNLNDVSGLPFKKLKRKGDYIQSIDFEEREELAKISSPMKWGVPVRYHDVVRLSEKFAPPLLEFHLSYQDLQRNLSEFTDSCFQDTQLVVHCPEMFQNSFILDVINGDSEYRNQSLRYLYELIELTESLAQFFPDTDRPILVCNLGGFSRESFMSGEVRERKLDELIAIMRRFKGLDVNVQGQSMAPFPWLFGGQYYQNILRSSEQISTYCEDTGLEFCFDVSHSFLECNYSKKDFSEFCELVLNYAGHLHLADARGWNGEGLQIGDGDIDWPEFFKILSAQSYVNRKGEKLSFIPEIWQGHKDEGSRFVFALNTLNDFLNGKS